MDRIMENLKIRKVGPVGRSLIRPLGDPGNRSERACPFGSSWFVAYPFRVGDYCMGREKSLSRRKELFGVLLGFEAKCG
jgi:hypothetical protein